MESIQLDSSQYTYSNQHYSTKVLHRLENEVTQGYYNIHTFLYYYYFEMINKFDTFLKQQVSLS